MYVTRAKQSDFPVREVVVGGGVSLGKILPYRYLLSQQSVKLFLQNESFYNHQTRTREGVLEPVMWLMLKKKTLFLFELLRCLSFKAFPLKFPSAFPVGWAHPSCCHHCALGRHIGVRYTLHCDVSQEATRYICVVCHPPLPWAGLGSPTEADWSA